MVVHKLFWFQDHAYTLRPYHRWSSCPVSGPRHIPYKCVELTIGKPWVDVASGVLQIMLLQVISTLLLPGRKLI